jgi:cobalt-zinc-cadmium efflux system protein
MTHDHAKAHDHSPPQGGSTAERRIGFAFFMNLAFALVETVGGVWTNSMAVLSDALHDLGDCAALGFGWHFQRVSRRTGDDTYTFGYRRFSLLIALMMSLLLLGGGIVVMYRAVPRLFAPEATNASGMLILAGVGIFANGVAALRMRGGRSLSERLVTWHLLEDVLSWAAVLVAALVMSFLDLPILDPILSILITAYVFWNVAKRLRETLVILLQGVPPGVRLEDVEETIRRIPGVCDVHHVHIWSQDGEHHVLTGHVVTPEVGSYERISELRRRVKEEVKQFGIGHTTLEFEGPDGPCCDDEVGACRTGGSR